MTDRSSAGAATSEPPAFPGINANMEADAGALNDAAAQCDSICLEAGAKLVEAVPVLNELSGRFTSLSKTLDGEELQQACAGLASVARGIALAGNRIAGERQSLAVLLELNDGLSRPIANVAEDIKFLSAMIPVVKVESVSIDDDTEGLQGFGRILEDLAAKARTAIATYQSAHGKLLQQLNEARRLQDVFALESAAGLPAITRGIEDSLAAVSVRRSGAVEAMTEVARAVQRIGTQTTEAVVALQIGDSIRQCLEHAQTIVLTPVKMNMTAAGREHAPGACMADQDIWFAIQRLYRLSALQIAEACDELRQGTETISLSLSDIGLATIKIKKVSDDLFKAGGQTSVSFLDDLGSRLKTARILIQDYERSRETIDGVTASVASTVAELAALGQNVSSLVADMTTIGTNAIIKSYRLGPRGAGLSIIAQHLRDHSLKVASGITFLSSSLDGVLDAARTFTESLNGNGTAGITALECEMAGILDVLAATGAILNAAMTQLKSDASRVEATVNLALATLAETDGLDSSLRQAAGRFHSMANEIEQFSEPSRQVDEMLNEVLRPIYSMEREREVHDALFSLAARA